MFDLILQIRYLIGKFANNKDSETLYKLNFYLEKFNRSIEQEIKDLRSSTVEKTIAECRILEKKLKKLKQEKLELIETNKSLKIANSQLARENFVNKKEIQSVRRTYTTNLATKADKQLLHENNLLRYQLLNLRNQLNKEKKLSQKQLFDEANSKQKSVLFDW